MARRRLRTRLIRAMLLIALLPVVGLTFYYNSRTRTLGRELADFTRDALHDSALRELKRAVTDYGNRIASGRVMIEVLLASQARAVDQSLNGPAPRDTSRRPIYTSEDFDQGNVPGLNTQPQVYFSLHEDGHNEPVPISFDHPVLVLAPGVDRDAVRTQVESLASLGTTYRYLFEHDPSSIYWQYTATTSGVHISYPGKGGYPADFDPRQRPWFQAVLQSLEARASTPTIDRDAVVWSLPHVDLLTRRLMLTAAMPVHDDGGNLIAVTAIDVAIDRLFGVVSVPEDWAPGVRRMLVVTPTDADPMVLAETGDLNQYRSWRESLAMSPLEVPTSPQMQAILDDLRAGRANVRAVATDRGQELWAYSPVGKVAMFLLQLDYDLILAPAARAERAVWVQIQWQVAATLLVMVLVAAGVIVLAFRGAARVTQGIDALAEAMLRIGRGDLTARADVRTGDEIEDLGRVLNDMTPRLSDHLRLTQSMQVAKEIQQSLLPHEPPTVPGLDLAGRSIFCDETGGDYYDYVPIDHIGSHGLAVAVGDVTGHGVAAALLMTAARALLRSHVVREKTLDSVMTEVNRRICADTPEGRFVTLFCLLLDADNRKLRWISAGHDPAILYRPATDTFHDLEGQDLPLGVETDWDFQECQTEDWQPGDVIVLGTDGIWEARNAAGEMFGKDRLRDTIRRTSRAAVDAGGQPRAAAVVEAVEADLKQFLAGVNPQDDVTTMAIVLAPGVSSISAG